jgi:hypothetical protein
MRALRLLACLLLVACLEADPGDDLPPPGDDPSDPLAPDDQVIPDDPGEIDEPDPNVAADCPWPVSVVVYGERYWNLLGDALAADASPCANYHVSLPAIVGDKTYPRGGGDLAAMHARGPRVHAMAEFHYTTWNAHVKATGITWYQAGVEFRRRMATAGYDPALGDSWAINELPSAVRSDPAVRANIRNLVRGLHDGPPGAPPLRGTVFVVGMGHTTVNFSVYKPNLKRWLEDAPFWATMKDNVRFWGQEVYADPARSCVPNTVVGARAVAINDYIMHVPRLAAAGGAATATARAYFDRAFVPIVNATWQTPQGYGDTMISLAGIEQHVSGQIYAARAWASTHAYPDGRLGFAWSPNDFYDTPDFAAEASRLATRLAAAVHGAYDDGGGAARFACSPSGAYTFCQCSLAGAAFNDGWKTFASY